MAWEMEEVEAVLERIWDLHDKISDAIHAVSRAHFLRSFSSAATGLKPARDCGDDGAASRRDAAEAGGCGQRNGFVFAKDFRAAEVATAAVAESRILNAIRTALEDLEDQLEFFHTVQSQQQAERDTAIARLEQSRIALAMRLAEHQGKNFKVLEEALAFVGNVHNKGGFVSPEDIHPMPQSQPSKHVEEHKGRPSGTLIRMFSYSLTIAKNSFRLDRIGGVFGNAAVFTVSMLALLQLHQVAFRGAPATLQTRPFYRRDENWTFPQEHPSKNSKIKQLDVLFARG